MHTPDEQSFVGSGAKNGTCEAPLPGKKRKTRPSASTNAFILPPCHNFYRLVYGDGTATTNLSGDCPIKIFTVELFSNHNLNSTSASEVLFITWNTISNEPLARRIVDNPADTFHTYTQGNQFNGEMRIESFSNVSGRGVLKYIYCSSIDAWIYQRGSY